VNAVIHQDARRGSGRKIADPADRVEEFSGGKILFAYLNHIHAVANGTRRGTEHVAAAPVGDVIADHRLTIFRDFQKRLSSPNPRTRSTSPSPDTAPRRKLFRRRPRR